MIEQRIQQQFYDSADHLVASAEGLARALRDAASSLLGAITAGARLHVYGHGASSVDAQRFVAGLVGRFERDRPALPAHRLGADAAALAELLSPHSPSVSPTSTGTVTVTAGLAGVALRQLQALALAGDVLVIVCADALDDAAALRALVDAAHAREMTVVAFSGRRAASWVDALLDTDVVVATEHERITRIRETHVVALHCLGDAVDLQLLGEQELE
jgi:D-sedoheptulose 7-phosphate isomerase